MKMFSVLFMRIAGGNALDLGEPLKFKLPRPDADKV